MTDSALIFTDDSLSELLEDTPNHAAPPAVTQAALLRIAGQLQITLLPERVLSLYFQQLRPHVPVDGMIYRHEALALEHRCGRRTRHRIRYRLLAEGQELGEITFHRARPFEEQETEVLETLLGALVYPLRNALLYHQAVQASRRDPLTGLWNRKALDEALHREIELARRSHRPLSLVVFDVDHFKRINDRFGHDAGDALLRCIAAVAERCCRASDIVYRYGGEEFVLLLGNTDQLGACRVAERLRRQVARSRCIHHEEELRATVSLGVATWREGETAETLFRHADEALYQAKAAGRNCVRSHTEAAEVKNG